jgi:transposase
MPGASGFFTMSTTEIDRLGVVQRVLEGRLTCVKAAGILGITKRQVYRLCDGYKAEGAAGLISRRRGKPSNNRTPQPVRGRAMELIREWYADFGPTLAAEKLAELHHIPVSRETVRHWMRAEGLWLSRAERVPRPHQPRYRRECLGELVQIDGCDHPWFEDRGPRCDAYECDGAAGLVSKRRGQPSNRGYSEDLRRCSVELVRDLYSDFGPTLAREKLIELHGIRVAKETLRKWMAAADIWLPLTGVFPSHTSHAIAGRAWASWSRSTDPITTGSRSAGRRARCSSTSTTRPAGSWSCPS